MTREEAIRILKLSIEKSRNHVSFCFDNKGITALDMAIKALKQEPSGDLISREKVCDYIAEFINHEYSTDAECEMVDLMIKGIQHMPSVKPQPCEDAISRSGAIKAIEKKAKRIKNEDTLNGLAGAVAILFDLPSVKPQEPKIGHWIMRHRKVNTINYRTGEDVLTGEIHTVKELIRYETDEPYCACCGKRAEDISQDYCGYCGARMESEG